MNVRKENSKTITEIPHQINSTTIFTSRGADFDKLVLSLALFPPLCKTYGDKKEIIVFFAFHKENTLHLSHLNTDNYLSLSRSHVFKAAGNW